MPFLNLLLNNFCIKMAFKCCFLTIPIGGIDEENLRRTKVVSKNRMSDYNYSCHPVCQAISIHRDFTVLHLIRLRQQKDQLFRVK